MATQAAAQPSPRPAPQHRDNRHPRSHPQQDRQPHPRGQTPFGGSRGAFHGDRGPRPPRRSAGPMDQPQAAPAVAPAAQYEAPVDLSAGLPAPHVISTQNGTRILCVAEIRGQISLLNKMARENYAQAIIHTGDFGFYEPDSIGRISDRTLRHLVQQSPVIPAALRSRLLTADIPGSRGGSMQTSIAAPSSSTPCREMRSQILAHPDAPLISEFTKLLAGEIVLDVPVYTVWGACEDVHVLEKIQMNEYYIPNLHVISEASSVAIEVGGLRLRLYGLGGALVMHKLFDTGEGSSTIAGGQGLMWTTLLQIGELIDTAQKTFDPAEIRVLVSHASPGREGLLMQLASALKADYTISAGLYFRYGVSYNEFCVQNDTEGLRKKFLQSKAAFSEVWDSVQAQLDSELDADRRVLLNNALAITNRIPNVATATGAVYEEPIYKNTWNWNLPDASSGHLVLDVRDENISCELKSQGFNFAHRRAMAVAAAAEAAARAAEEAEARASAAAAAAAAAEALAAAQRQAAAQAQISSPAAQSPGGRQLYQPRDTRPQKQSPAPARGQVFANNGGGQDRSSSAPKQFQQRQANGAAANTQAEGANADSPIARPIPAKAKRLREDKRAAPQNGRDAEGKQIATPKPIKSIERSAPSVEGTATKSSVEAADPAAPSSESREDPRSKQRANKRKTFAERKAAARERGDKPASGAAAAAPQESKQAQTTAISAPAAPAAASAEASKPSSAPAPAQNAATKADGGAANTDAVVTGSAEAPAAGEDGKSMRGLGRGRGRGGRGRGGRGTSRGRGGGKTSGSAPAATGGS